MDLRGQRLFSSMEMVGGGGKNFFVKSDWANTSFGPKMSVFPSSVLVNFGHFLTNFEGLKIHFSKKLLGIRHFLGSLEKNKSHQNFSWRFFHQNRKKSQKDHLPPPGNYPTESFPTESLVKRFGE